MYEMYGICMFLLILRGVINDKAVKAAALPEFSDTLSLSQPGGADYAHPLVLSCLKKSLIPPLRRVDRHW
jgi:hypothetical protein